MWEDEAFANYICGQADADSCFYIAVRRGRTYKFGILFVPGWSITKAQDPEILMKIREFLGFGKIYTKQPTPSGRKATMRLYVEGKDCSKLVSFFERFPSRAGKRRDFELWKKAVAYMNRQHGRYNPWTKEELNAMLEIRNKLHMTASRVRRQELQRIQPL